MSETPSQRVAGEVRAALARRRLSQAQLAQALNLSQAAVSRRLVGLVPFDIDELGIVAEFVGVPLSDLLAEHRAAS